LIAAHSAQAKGRIERLWETFQDRLVKALREAGASNVAEANQVLERFLPKFNARFRVAPAQPGSAYLPWPADYRSEQFFCFKHTRIVTNDNTISFDGHRLQIPPGPQRRSYAEDPGRRLAAFGWQPGGALPGKPAADHPWRKPLLAKKVEKIE
jgi:hypothetical protein